MKKEKDISISLDEILAYNFRLLLTGELDADLIAPVISLLLESKKYQHMIKKDIKINELLQLIIKR